MSLEAGQYIVAGVDTVCSLVDRFLNKFNDRNYFSSELYSSFLSQTVNKYLYSFGTGLSYKTKKLSKKHVERITRETHRIKNCGFMDNTKLFIDSGGFQVSMGAVTTDFMPTFIKMYHDFLQNENQYYEHAFSLDLPPGPGSENIFSSYQQIENLNRMSYQMSSNMPQQVKDKMIYIHHFRTPSLYKTWSKFLWDENLADGYNYFGTGGIVANMAADTTIPIIIYTIPLSSIVRYAKNKNIKSFNFHILGGANYTDLFYHKLFSYHIKKVHDLDVNITYDSSAIFKGLVIGRFVPVMKLNNCLVKMDLRSSKLHLRFDDTTINEKIYQLMDIVSDTYNFRKIIESEDPVYNQKTNTFSHSIHMYLMAYLLHIYRKIEQIAEESVEEFYPYYEAGQIKEFDSKCIELTRRLNQGKRTRKQKAKTYSIFKSLKLLTELDEDYNKFLVNKFMSVSDISVMDGSGTIKF